MSVRTVVARVGLGAMLACAAGAAASEREAVASRYVVRADGRVGLEVGAYDARRELVIDPKVKLSTYLGGSGVDSAEDVALAFGTQPVLVGLTDSVDFPGDTGAPPDETAAFLVQLDAAGALVHTVLLDGQGDDQAVDVAVDGSGNAYVVGLASRDFPTLAGYDQTHGLVSARDAFVAKLDPAGRLVFSSFLGGSGIDMAVGVALDAARRVYVVGFTDSNAGFPTRNRAQGCGVTVPFSVDSRDAFLTVFEPAGTSLLYSTCLGGVSDSAASDVAVDAAGNAYVVGVTNSTSTFPTKSPSPLPPFQADYGGGPSDGFVAKFDPHASGDASLVYSTLLGGGGTDQVLAVAVEPTTQRATVTGVTGSTNFPRLGGFDSTNVVNEAFVTKLNADGTALFYSTFLGGNGEDAGSAVAVDAQGHAYVAGRTCSTDFGPLAQFDASPLGACEAFAVKVAPDGARRLYAVLWGGSQPDDARGLALDASGAVYVVGATGSGDYPATAGAAQAAFGGGGGDGFLVKLAPQNAETIGLWNPDETRFLLRNSNASDAGRQDFQFGLAGDVPVCGDWDGDGDETCGVFRDGTFRLLNAHRGDLGAPPALVVSLGDAGDRPVAGDWDGDGRDGVGVFTAGGQFLLDDDLDGSPDLAPFAAGLPSDLPVAGDWDGDGVDTVGLFRAGRFQLLLSNQAGSGAVLANFGAAGDAPVVGDWDGDAVTTLGVFTPGVFGQRLFRLRNSNTTGPAELSFIFGAAGDIPLAGDWNGRP